MKPFSILLLWFIPLCLIGQNERETIKFDFGWRFHLGDVTQAKEPGFNDSGWRQTDVPHDWSIEGEFDAKLASCTAYLPGGIGWYRKSFEVPESWKGKSVTIQFDGVYNNSEVWVNGHYLGLRPNGYISFFYEIAPFLEIGGKNVVSVRVDHSKSADTRWYSGSGIYRHVWMIVAHPVHIARWGTFVTTPKVSGSEAGVVVETEIRATAGASLQVVLVSSVLNRGGSEVARKETTVSLKDLNPKVRQEITLPDPELWNLENPYLYTLRSAILIDGAVVDATDTPFGIRTLEFNPETGFFLNGRNIKMKGVCLHHDGGCVGAAVPEKIWEIRLRKLKEAGCNAIRTSHNPVAPEFLDLCDRMGFLVMNEAFDEWEYPKRKWIDGWNETIAGQEGYARYFRQWALQDLKDLVLRDRNHPSVIMWSIGNEIDYANDPYADYGSDQPQQHQGYSPNRPDAYRMVEIAQTLKEVIRESDPSRPVTMALANISNSRRIGLPGILDIVGYNYTESRYEPDHRDYPGEFIYGSENPHHYSGWLSVKNNPFISAQFLWTGVDYLGEAAKFPARSAYSGLLDLSNREKSIYYWRQSMWSDDPVLFLTARRKTAADKPNIDPMAKLAWFVSEVREQQHWNYHTGDTILVMAYTNCAAAELFLNGKPIGKKSLDPANSSLWWHIPYEPGEISVVSTGPDGISLRSSLKTVSGASSIGIFTEAAEIRADRQDISIIELILKDKDGNPAYLATNRIDFEISGPGRIIGTDNGDATCLDNLKLPWRKCYQGRCIAIIQSTGAPGTITVRARTQGLPDTAVQILAKH